MHLGYELLLLRLQLQYTKCVQLSKASFTLEGNIKIYIIIQILCPSECCRGSVVVKADVCHHVPETVRMTVLSSALQADERPETSARRQ